MRRPLIHPLTRGPSPSRGAGSQIPALPLSRGRERGSGGGGHFVGTLLVLLLLLCATPALAQAPEKERRFVYGLNLFDGTQFTTGFVPPAVDTVYVLADHLGVLDPKRTEVYFWPITNDYRADFTSLNELVPGRLEIGQGGRVIATLDLTEYVVQVDRSGKLGPGEIFLGDAAQRSWERFQTERAAYLDRLRAHADAVAEYNRQVEVLQAQTGMESPLAPFAVPVEPAPFTLYSTEVGRGFPIQLPAGEYTIRVLDAAGQTVADSQKRLVAFGPRRLGVGFEIVPQERWTFPEQADDPADVVYTVAGGVTYLRAFAAQELNAEAYARLRNPQDLAATPNRWQWVRVAPLGPATMVVYDGTSEQRLEIEDFAVEQLPGANLGYRVVPFGERGDDPRPSRAPDLTAYRVEAPAGRATLSLRLVDADGRELPGSARQVVVVSSAPGWQLSLPVLVPLAIGLSVWLWRREQVRTASSLSVEQRRRMA
jgi:hypothetical protein